MKTIAKTFFLVVGVALMAIGCSKDNESVSPVDPTLNASILTDFSTNLSRATYNDLAAKTSTFYDNVVALTTGTATDDELKACRATWKQARQSWEQSEAFLFGPVSTGEIDPRIDTWPVNHKDLDSLLNSSNKFEPSDIDNLEFALKGFHPIEYLIFGEDGNAPAENLTERKIQYLTALATNLKSLTATLKDSWDPETADNYYNVFVKAGAGSSVYGTQREAFEEMVNAMTDICDEVANGKIDEVFVKKDPTREESPFAKNSIIDFTNNIKGVQNVYLGKFTNDGKGLEDLVRNYNLQLDGDIKTKMNNAIAALGNITDPFGTAITTQTLQVQAAIDAINSLKSELEDNLLPFVQLHTK